MLTIQPKFNKTAFEAKKPTPEEIRRRREEREIQKRQDEFLDSQEELESIAENSPSIAKKVFKTGAVVAGAGAVAVSTGYGAKLMIQGMKKFYKTGFMISVRKHFNATMQFIKDSAKTIKTKFLESDAYKMPANSIKKNYGKFGETKIGEPIVKVFNSIGRGIKIVYNKIADGARYIKNKITGVKQETWEKGTINTVGGASGTAAAVNGYRESQEVEE